MNRPLSRRRHIENDQMWSDNINDFLNSNATLESNSKLPYVNTSNYTSSKRIQDKHQKRSNYEVARKAFLSSQNHHTTMYKRYQAQMEKTDALIKKGKTPACIQKQYDFVHVPVNQVDDHVIERIISKRNKEYKESSKSIHSHQIGIFLCKEDQEYFIGDKMKILRYR